MKKITKNNYEAFLLDFMEGKLSGEEHAALLLFLEQHPEIEFDFDLNMHVLHTEESVSFNKKSDLKKTEEEKEENVVFYLDDALSKQERGKFEKQLVDDKHLQTLLTQYQKTKLNPEFFIEYRDKASLIKLSVWDELLIANSEGLLTGLEKEHLLTSIENNEEAKRDLYLFENTKLVADNAIKFPNKESLKRSAIIIFLKSKAPYLSIAASLILFFTWIYTSQEGTEKTVYLADLEQKSIPRYMHLGITKNASSKKEITPHLPISIQIKEKTNTPVSDNNALSSGNNIATNELKTTNLPLPIANIENTVSHDENVVNINYYDGIAENDVIVLESQPTLIEKMEAVVWNPKGDSQTIINENKKSESLKMNLLALFAKGLQKLGNKKSKAEKIYHEDEGYTEYNVCIAGITISRKEMN